MSTTPYSARTSLECSFDASAIKFENDVSTKDIMWERGAPQAVLTGVGVVEVRFVATNDLTHRISSGSALERYSVTIETLLLTR